MNRKELANKMFMFLKHNTNRKEKDIWKAIAETDDYSLLDEFEKNARKIDADEQYLYQIIVDIIIKIVYSNINKTNKQPHSYNTTPVKARRMLDRG